MYQNIEVWDVTVCRWAKGSRSFEGTAGASDPQTRRHIPEGPNPQQHYCENHIPHFKPAALQDGYRGIDVQHV